MIRLRCLVTFFLVCSACAAFAQVAGSGTSFVLTLPAGAVANLYSIPKARLFLTSQAGASVTVQYGVGGPVDNVVLAPGSSDETIIDSALVMLPEQEGKFTSTILVTSDNPITCALLLDRAFASEGYAALPDTLLGMQYFAVSTSESEYGGIVAVVGVEDSTLVSITPAVPTRGGRSQGLPFTVQLNRGEVYQILTKQFASADLTGTTVSSNKRCGVLSGSVCADLNIGFEHRCNPLLEQLPGSDSWGKEFVVGPLERAPVTPFRIVARCPNTSVKINDREVAVLGRGENIQVLLDTIYRISTTEPVMVAQMVANTSSGLQDRSVPSGDPSMMVVAPRDQWSRSFSFYAASLAARTDVAGPVGWRHFVQIAIRDGAQPGVLVDGAPPAWGRMMIAGGWAVASVEIGPGMHTVTSPDRMGVTTYGYSASDAYGYNPGSIDHAYLLAAPNLSESACTSKFDTAIVVTNMTDEAITVESMATTPGLDLTITDPALPFTIPPRGSQRVAISLNALATGQGHGNLYLLNGSCPTRLLNVKIDIGGNLLSLQPIIGSTIDFGALPSTIPYSERPLKLINKGAEPITVDPISISSPEFTIVQPAFPLVIPPGRSVTVTLRYTPTANGTNLAQLGIHVANCPDSQFIQLKGQRRRGGYLAAIPPTPRVESCGPKVLDTLPFRIINLGDYPLYIISATLAGVPGEFTFVTPLAGITINQGDTLTGQVLYTPGALGTRSATLNLVTNSLNEGAADIGFSERNDTIIIKTSIDRIDLGTLYTCDSIPSVEFDIHNAGTGILGVGSGVLPGSIRGTVTFPGVSRDRLLAPGDSQHVIVKFDSAFVGDVSDTLLLGGTPSPCNLVGIPLHIRRLRASLATGGDTIDFGTLSACSSMSERRLVLRNDGAVADTLAIAHLPASPAEADPASFPLAIPSGDSAVIPLRFHPTVAGTFLDSIDIEWGPCGRTKHIIVRGSFDPALPSISPATVDFGGTIAGAASARVVWLVNRTTVPYRLSGASFGGSSSGVRLLNPALPVTIAPGDSVRLDLAYIPNNGGDTLSRDAFLLFSSPCNDSLALPLTGYSIDEPTKLALRWEDDSALVGKEIPLRLTINQSSPGITGDSLLLHAGLRFNASVLLPLGAHAVAPGVTAAIVENRIEGGDRIIRLDVSGLFPLAGTLAEVNVRVMLGDADSTRLALDTLRLVRTATQGTVNVGSARDGTFRVLGICRAGGERLIGISGLFRLAATRPNPVADRAVIEFETVEQGRTRLAVSDARGRECAVLLDEPVAPGIYQVELDARPMPDGLYVITLQSPTRILRGAMVVVR